MTDDTLEQVEGFNGRKFLTDFDKWLKEGEIETTRNQRFSRAIIHGGLAYLTNGLWVFAIVGYYLHKFYKQSDEEYVEVKEYEEV